MDLVKDSKPLKLKPTRKQESAEIADMRRRGLKVEEIATIKCVKKAAISRRLGRAGVEHSVIAQFRADEPSILAGKRSKLWAALDDAKIAKMSGKEIVISGAILLDKERLITGASAVGGTVNLLAIANAVHQAYQLGKLKGGGEAVVVEAEVVSPPSETVVVEVDCGEA